MKGNVIMWTCQCEGDADRLSQALSTATDPIRKAMKHFWWEDVLNLVTDGDCPKEHWRNLYFYLSGYGDAEWQLTNSPNRQAPVAIPEAPKKKGTKQ